MKRCICLILVLSMLFSMIPNVFAKDHTKNADSKTVTWLDVVYSYPEYMRNNYADVYQSDAFVLCEDIFEEFSGMDVFFSSLEYTLVNAGSIKTFVTTVTDFLGLTNVLHNKAADKAIIQVMKNIYEDKNSAFWSGTVSASSNAIKIFDKTLTSLDSAYKLLELGEVDYDFAIDNLSKAQVALKYFCETAVVTSCEVDATVFGAMSANIRWTFIEDVFEYYKDYCTTATEALKIAKTLTAIMFMINIEGELLDYLSQMPLQKELVDAVNRLKNDRKTNFISYFKREYLTNKVMDTILKQIDSDLFGSTPPIAKLITIGCSLAQWMLFDLVYAHADAEDVLVYIYLASFAYTTRLTFVEKTNYIANNPITNKNIDDFEYFYPVYTASVKAMLEFSKKITTKSERENEVETLMEEFDSEKLRNALTLAGYKNNCIYLVDLIPAESRATRQPDWSKKYLIQEEDFLVSDVPPEDNDCNWIYPSNGMIYYGFKWDWGLTDSTGTLMICPSAIYEEHTLVGDIYMTAGGFQVNSGVTLNILGKCDIERNWYAKTATVFTIAKDATVNVAKGFRLPGDYNEHNPTLKLYGSLNVRGDFTTGIRVGFNVSGTLNIGGNVSLETNPSGSGVIILDGSTKQTFNGQYKHLVIRNTSSEGVATSGTVSITETIDNQATKCTGTIMISGGHLIGPNFVGTIKCNSFTQIDSVVIHGSVSNGDGGIFTIPEGVTVVITGNYTQSQGPYADDCGMVVKQNGCLVIEGNCTMQNYSYFNNYGTVDMRGDFSIASHVPLRNSGTISVGGDALLDTWMHSSSGSFIINGSSAQTVYGDFYNLTIANKTGALVTLKETNVSNALNNQSTPISGTFTLNGGYLVGPNFVGNLNVSNTTFRDSVTIKGNVQKTGVKYFTVPKGKTVTVNGNLRVTRDDYTDAGGLKIESGAKVYVTGTVDIVGVAHTILDGTLESLGNFTLGTYTGWNVDGEVIAHSDVVLSQYPSSGTLTLKGNKVQKVSAAYSSNTTNFNYLILDKEGGSVTFDMQMSVSKLFDHRGIPFTLYRSGSGSKFVDYDGDGLKDNVDPQPTVGKACTITVKSSNEDYGTVDQERIETVGGTTVTITATPNFKYQFVGWKNSAGKTVSTSKNYTFVVKASDTYTAQFAKRKRPITVETLEGGVVTAPAEAEIESTVSVQITEQPGYMYEEGSLCYNSIPIEKLSFIMPDKAVVITARFVRNPHYFALEEKILEAEQYEYENYTTDSFEHLVEIIEGAMEALQNHITEEESNRQIELISQAIEGLKEKSVVGIRVVSIPTLYVAMEELIQDIEVQLVFDNGTSMPIQGFAISGYDSNVHGEQTITVFYEGMTTTAVVNVQKRPMSNTTVAAIPSQIYLGEGLPCEPEVTIVCQLTGEEMVYGTDYALSYSNNTAPGRAQVVITGIGNYSGTRTVYFTIYCTHAYEQANLTPPTCTATGKLYYTCAICGETKTETVAMAPHTYVGDYCKDCQYRYSGTLLDFRAGSPELGYSWTMGTGTGAPTFDTTGTGRMYGTLAGSEPATLEVSMATNQSGFRHKVSDGAEVIQLRIKVETDIAADGYSYGISYKTDVHGEEGNSSPEQLTDYSVKDAGHGYKLLTFPLPEDLEGQTIETLCLEILKGVSEAYTGSYDVDCVYLGLEKYVPSAMGLFFDFTNKPEDQDRYAGYPYGGYNYDTKFWVYNSSRNNKPVYDNSAGTVSFTMPAGGDSPYLQTTDATGTSKAKPLAYNPGANDVMQIRFKMENCSPMEGKTAQLMFIAIKDNEEDISSDSKVYVDLEDTYLNMNGFGTITVPMTEAFRNADIINAVRVVFWNIIPSDPKTAKITIDYIYVGPEENAPIEDHLYFGFTNTQEDQERYSGKTYTGHNFDTGNWIQRKALNSMYPPVFEDGTMSSIVQSDTTICYFETGLLMTDNWLSYNPQPGDYIQARVKIDSSNGENNTKTPTVSFIFSENGEQKVDSEGASMSPTTKVKLPKGAVNQGYHTVTIPLHPDTIAAYDVGAMRIDIAGLNYVPGDKITVDYIYVGQYDTLPSEVAKVIFSNEDGTTLYEHFVFPGEKTTYQGATPTKAADVQGHYVFDGTWKTLSGEAADLTNITESVTLYPSFRVETHTGVLRNELAPTCTAEGYSGDICCEICGYLMESGTTVEPISHSYNEEGLCVCGKTRPIQEPSWKLGRSLDLASDISVNFAVSKASLTGFDMDTVYVLAELDVYEGNTKTGTRTVKLLPVEQGNYYYFTLTGLTAVNMNDSIRSVLYGTKDGQEYYSATDEYSIATYAYTQMNKTTMPESLKTLCADLLRYGAKAQIFKAYRTDTLADAAMTEAHRAFLSDMDSLTFGKNNTVLDDLDNAPIVWMGKTLDLASKVNLKFIFDPAGYEGDPEKLTLRVSFQSVDGETRAMTLTGGELYNSNLGLYAFTFDGLLAAELRAVVSVQIYEGDTPVSCTLQYSADTYGNNKTGDLGTLCRALFAYSDSARAFFQ